jgi:hypothetical protein
MGRQPTQGRRLELRHKKREVLQTRTRSAAKRSVKNATSESNDPIVLMKS